MRRQQATAIGDANCEIGLICFALDIFGSAQPTPSNTSTASKWLGQTLHANEPMPAAHSWCVLGCSPLLVTQQHPPCLMSD